MAAIVHRQVLRGAAPVARSEARSRTATVAIVVFSLAALAVAAIELAPAIQAFIEGVTDYLGTLSPVLPTAFRAASLVLLPALVAWASPARPTANGWLWRGALIVSLVTLARYGAEPIQQAIVDGAAGQLTVDSREYLIASGIGLLLAFGSLLGVWALSEGLKDAGARLAAPIVGLAVVMGLIATVLIFGPSMASVGDAVAQGQTTIPLFAASVVVNTLFFVTQALLVARALAGARLRLRPRAPWIAGAVAALVLFLFPFISLLRQMLVQYVTNGEDPLPIPTVVLLVTVFFGWPLFAAAIGNGMGRLNPTAPAPMLTSTGFTVRGPARYTPAP